jgi:hypothetical protein
MRGLFLLFRKKSAEFRIRRRAVEVRNRRTSPNINASGALSMRSACASSRRRGALNLFRLAGVVLHTTASLYDRHMIPKAGVRAGLSVSGYLESWAAALHPCLGRSRHRNRREEARR